MKRMDKSIRCDKKCLNLSFRMIQKLKKGYRREAQYSTKYTSYLDGF